ncbi:MAG: UDP-N-acetylmuramoyl-L-alanyl-D-glutamate--2,6-diaminopimelate ligase [Ignavibacteria bacterium]
MMKFSEIAKKFNITVNLESENDFEVKGLSCNSENVKEGYIFFAIKGLKNNGNKFTNDAIRNGAKIIFSEEDAKEYVPVGFHKVNQIRKLMALVSGYFYGNPSLKLKLMGITGTNGKTTTSYLIRSFLKDAGFKTGIIGTIGYDTGDVKMDSTMTTPDSIETNMMLGEMVNSKIDFCLMEVSSIALSMDRVYGMNFETAVFTNLTSEHLDFHHDMSNYFEAKKLLFDRLTSSAHAISNTDDEYGRIILNDTKAKKFFYSMKNESGLKAFNERITLSGLEFEVKYKDKSYKLSSNLTGRFNIYNILASVSAVLQYDIDMNFLKESLQNFKEVDGRFNRIKLPNGAIAIIDYSHTSDSLKNAIESAREIVSGEQQGKVITIFGCGGNKDRTKRPVMGNYATELSDHSIITSDNPRYENPMEIIKEILTGVNTKNNYEVIENREEAISRGIEIARSGDIVLICGKGHETYQDIGGVKSHFDDKEIVAKYLSLAK